MQTLIRYREGNLKLLLRQKKYYNLKKTQIQGMTYYNIRYNFILVVLINFYDTVSIHNRITQYCLPLSII